MITPFSRFLQDGWNPYQHSMGDGGPYDPLLANVNHLGAADMPSCGTPAGLCPSCSICLTGLPISLFFITFIIPSNLVQAPATLVFPSIALPFMATCPLPYPVWYFCFGLLFLYYQYKFTSTLVTPFTVCSKIKLWRKINVFGQHKAEIKIRIQESDPLWKCYWSQWASAGDCEVGWTWISGHLQREGASSPQDVPWHSRTPWIWPSLR